VLVGIAPERRGGGVRGGLTPLARAASIGLLATPTEAAMALTTQVMTDEQRKSVALEYLKAFDNAGVTSSGGSILDLFADDAQLYFPKWGLANGKEEIGRVFSDVGATLVSIRHDYAGFNWILTGSDVLVCEGTSYGEHRDGPWRAGVPDWGAGRWCDVFEIRDWKIQRCFIYLDPDYAGGDTARYPWLTGRAATEDALQAGRS
jgi:hypothetical protein